MSYPFAGWVSNFYVPPLISLMRQHEFLFSGSTFATEDFVAMRVAAESIDYLFVI